MKTPGSFCFLADISICVEMIPERLLIEGAFRTLWLAWDVQYFALCEIVGISGIWILLGE